MKNDKRPELSFHTFNDDWKCLKLSEIFKILDGDRGKNYPHEEDFFENGDTLFLDTGNVRRNGFRFTKKKYITKEKDRLLKGGKLEVYDFVLTSRGTLGNLAYYNQNQYKRNSSVRINSAMLILRPINRNEVVDSYMEAVLRGNLIHSYMLHYQVGSAQPHITKKGFSNMTVSMPSSLQEQQQIGEFFKKIDEIIDFCQRKLELLKQTKQGFLQKMFPKEGESVPELRFPGFTDDWEQHKLGEKLDLLKDGTHGTHKDVDEGVYLLSAKNIKNGQIVIDGETDRKISKDEFVSIHKNFSLEKGDVLLTIVGSIGESAIIENPDGITFQRSVAYFRPTKDLSAQFLFTTIQNSEFQIELKKRQVVSAQPGIYLGDLSIIPIQVPVVQEQQKIGSFFKQLDDTIALHQRELDLLKQTKKAFLQKMFI